jgi:hypothetical protein
VGAYAAHGPEGDPVLEPTSGNGSDLEKSAKDFNAVHVTEDESFQTDQDAMAQLIGVGILEFGVILHRHVLYSPPPFTHRHHRLIQLLAS